MGTPVDFDLAVLILRVLEGWELGNRGLYRKYWSYKKIIKNSKFDLGPGNPKNRFSGFFRNFYDKNGLKSGNGISSETTWESRVRRPGNLE